ncbi:Oxo-4-hydroxy-4-carboxy-5-ureidoimidazoline decarboxylase [Infundibulicybe gibba]|nr:Oxo-4-hydroxy-4-carboxy-5-ureidoimidazoline decarboxylase [Infundibulicybe gibba]
MESSIPTITAILEGPSGPHSPLAQALSLLFEHSPILASTLEPRLAQALQAGPHIESYTELIDKALADISTWDLGSQANFIAGHPRIGESKNISRLSANEQGATANANATPPDVLIRLAYLNEFYESRYPGLRYITFVNGRSRAEIVKEMEAKLGLDHNQLSPSIAEPLAYQGEEWRSELDRAIGDIGKIAKSRLSALGVQ